MTFYPELRDVPPRIETPRLVLRWPQPGDGARLHAAVMASLDHLRPWMVWAQRPMDADGYEAHLRQAAGRFLVRKELRYLIFDASEETLLGSSGFHSLDWRVPKAEIGYWIDARHTGQGYVTETALALTDFGFDTLRLRRIEIRCDAANLPSARVAERAGYTLDARLVNDDVAADDPARLRDTLVYSRTR